MSSLPTRSYDLPAFKQPFEKSQISAAFTTASLADVAATVDTADKRAAMDPKDLSKALAVLSSRLVTAASRPEPEAAEAAVIASLPEELRTPVGALTAAIDADGTNAALNVWLATLQSKPEAEVFAAAEAAYVADPTNPTIFAIVLAETFKKSTKPPAGESPLVTSVVLGDKTKTLGEWLDHGVALDEHSPAVWHFIAQLLGALRNAERQAAAREFQSMAEGAMKNATTDAERHKIQLEIMAVMQKALQEHRPSVAIGGQDYNGVMVAARMVQLYQMQIAAFGGDVVSFGTRFDGVPLGAKTARGHFNDACKLLVFELDSNEEVTTEVYENCDGRLLVSDAKTHTEFTLVVDILNNDQADASLWASLANILLLKEQPASVEIDGQEMSMVECAAKACEFAPTEKRFWELLMTLLVTSAKAGLNDPENHTELAAAVHDMSVTVAGVPLPARTLMSLAQQPPASKPDFIHGLKQIEQHRAVKKAEDMLEKKADGQGQRPLEPPSNMNIALTGIALVCCVAGWVYMKKKGM